MSGAGGSPRTVPIHIYPLKAGRAVDLAESVAEPWGLAGSPSPCPGGAAGSASNWSSGRT
jgi:hypothetical protein